MNANQTSNISNDGLLTQPEVNQSYLTTNQDQAGNETESVVVESSSDDVSSSSVDGFKRNQCENNLLEPTSTQAVKPLDNQLPSATGNKLEYFFLLL